MKLAYYVWSYALTLPVVATLLVSAEISNLPVAHADNTRLNNGVFENIYTAQRLNGCTTPTRLDRRLADAAKRHALDLLDNRDINGDIGSDGSTPQDRARDTGFRGKVAETIATNPAVAISGMEILEQWWYDAPIRVIMQDCSNTAIGVWSENSPDRSVVVAMYGQPGTL